jgi:dihydroorotate dehydrogenase electron transfer subunit
LKQVSASIISNRNITADFYLMWLEAAEIAAEAKPGQFLMVRCGKELILPRPFSIHQRNGNQIALLFTVVGKGTAWLAQRRAGDKVDVFGPLGNGFTIQPTTKTILLVAGGIGLAPLVFLAEVARKKNVNIELIIGGPTKGYLLPVEMLFPSTTILYESITKVTEDGSVGKRGIVTDALEFYADYKDTQIFACGPLPMYQTMARMSSLKDKPVQISLEVRMGCGLGVCYGCTVKTKTGLKQVCKDGPVFDLDDILWAELGG